MVLASFINRIRDLFKNKGASEPLYRGTLFHESFFTENYLADLEQFEIGAYTYGNPNILFSESGEKLKIGKFCSIATNVNIFLGGNHRTDWVTTYPFNIFFQKNLDIKGHPSSNGGVTIGNDVWLGRDVTILSGVTIGDGAVVGAGSLVTKNIDDYEVWGGNPARFIRLRFTEAEIVFLKRIQWWNWPIEKIIDNVELLCGTPEMLINKECLRK